MPRAPHPFLLHTLRRLFAPVLHRHGREAPALREIELRTSPYPRDVLEVVAIFEDGNDQHLLISEQAVEDARAWSGLVEFANDLVAHAHRVWSEEYENRLMNEGRRAMQEVVRHAYDRGDYRAGDMVRQMYEQNWEHIQRFHRETAPPPVFRGDYSAEADCTTVSINPVSPREMTATAILRSMREREPEVRRQQRRIADMMRDMYDRAVRGVFGEVGTRDAQAKGMKLLKENLTPEQRAQYEQHNYFDVKGGTSGKTYRIHHGRQMNIHQLNKRGRPVCGWCFLPSGGLVAGDVMLAQKTALEVCEQDALRVANRFQV